MFAPVAPAPEPLWLALRTALDEHGYSVRGFARLCHEHDPRQSWESWKRTLNKALDEDKPYNPSRETAELWSSLLGKPADYFVRLPTRKADLRAENERLREEIARLRRELDHREQASNG